MYTTWHKTYSFDARENGNSVICSASDRKFWMKDGVLNLILELGKQ